MIKINAINTIEKMIIFKFRAAVLFFSLRLLYLCLDENDITILFILMNHKSSNIFNKQSSSLYDV